MGSGLKMLFFLGICFLLAFALFSCLVDASLACGQVNSTDRVEPQWMKVKVYSQDRNKSISCSVSPAENKFCCDTEAILNFTWAVGKQVNGEIFNEKYFTDSVSLKISGEGYDVFPLMQLKKAITVNNLSRVVFSQEPKFLLNASFNKPFTHVEIEKEGNRQFLYQGEEYQGYINGSFGMNYFKIIAGDGSREFSESFIIAVLKNFELKRAIECDKCKNSLIKSNKEGVIRLNISLSHEVRGLELKEYVPKEFEILETDGEIREYSSTHNIISWNVSGKTINKAYKIRAPKISFFPRKYVFRAELEDTLLREDKITVSRFFSFWSFDEGIELKSIERKVYSRISPQTPLVYRFDNNEITRMAIFPKQAVSGAELIVEESMEGNLSEAENREVKYYSFDTNIAVRDIEKIFVEFKVPKNNSGNLSLYVFEKGWEEWEASQLELSREDKDYAYYQAYIPATKKIALAGKEKDSWNFLRLFS